MNKKLTEKQIWDKTSQMLEKNPFNLGRHWSYNFLNDPKRLGFVLSRYKFAAKMACKNASILELGCSEGIGAPILAENAKSYLGVDLDDIAISDAQKNFNSSKFKFIYDDFMNKHYGKFDAVISLDVVEHIYSDHEKTYFDTIFNNLSENGICVVGTPNSTSSVYASEASMLGHVNLFSQQRLIEVMKNYFHQVFCFGINDEIVHTGFAPMAHYLICIGCHKKGKDD